jgi:hypothetical protein
MIEGKVSQTKLMPSAMTSDIGCCAEEKNNLIFLIVTIRIND